MSSGRHRTEAARPRVVRLAGEKSVRQGSSGGLCSRTTRSTRAWRRLCTLQPLQRGRRQQGARAASWHRCLGIKITELAADLKEKTTRRERGCRGRHHRTMAKSEVPEDRARTPRWPARAKTALPGRSRAVRSCGRIGRKCTTRTPSVPDRTSPSPRGECPALVRVS